MKKSFALFNLAELKMTPLNDEENTIMASMHAIYKQGEYDSTYVPNGCLNVKLPCESHAGFGDVFLISVERLGKKTETPDGKDNMEDFYKILQQRRENDFVGADSDQVGRKFR